MVSKIIIYVVVQIYSWFKFYFSLFLSMVMYDNESETIRNRKGRRKLNHNTYTSLALKSLVLQLTAFLVLAKK